MLAREEMIALAFKYQGDHALIQKAILVNEKVAARSYQNCVVIYDEHYPKLLYQLAQAPFVLFYEGNLELLNHKSVGIVGSRNTCDYGLYETGKLVENLNPETVVVSGLALGIDGYAHACALTHCKTLAVLGHGLDMIYPKANEKLYHRIKNEGLLISEYPPGTPIRKHQFVHRNRIIAALSNVLCVMQAQIKSGTMSTVEYALSLGIEIYALPYHVDEVEGSGCNLLIQQGASLLTSTTDLFKL